MRTIAKQADLDHGLRVLRRFINPEQLAFLETLCNGPEGEHFADKVIEVTNRVTTMPQTFDTQDQGDDAIVHLHYFMGACDWYITEKDCEMPQHQAFGWCDLGMGFPELGYVSIEELKQVGAELDLYWTPKTLAEVKAL